MGSAYGTTRFLPGCAQDRDVQRNGRGRRCGPDDPPDESAPRAVPSLIGSRVGPYLITKRLGAGGVGEVFKAVDVMLKREVAIKVLRHELASDPLFLERFNQEARLHAKLSHPNVASVHAFLHEGDKQFMVMEYVAGISLDEFVRAGGPVPVERALSIFARALAGIGHAHHCGIVHRDIKPANIMLADNGQVKVMDFGIARALDSQDRLTRHGQVAGTARAMSPEQIRGAQADVRSDIYSLGIVLYTLLAGRAPFDGENDLALMRAQLEQSPPPLRGLVDHLPSPVEAAVMRALEKDPSARFQTVGAFSQALDACLAELTSPLPIPDQPDPTASPRTVLNPALHHAPMSSRTVMNPAVHDGRRRAAAWRTLRRLDPRVVAVTQALLALLAGTVVVTHQQAMAPAAERTEADRIPALSVHEQASAAVLQPTFSPPSVVPAIPRTLAITRLAAEDTAASDVAHRFKPGEHVRLLVTTSHDAHVYCYLQDETQHIVRFYPNRFSANTLVRADVPLEVPGRMGFEIVANDRNVAETIACFATEQDILAQLPVAIVGTDLASLPATSLAEVKSAFARTAGATPAEASFRVEVK